MTTIPKGFRIVPEEPTDEMMAAAIRLGTLEKWRDNFRTGDQYRIAMYKAMLAAAPTPAHSKSEYKRLNALGANVAPPDDNTAGWISERVTGPDEYGSVYIYFQPHAAGAVGRTIRSKTITVNVDYDKLGILYGIELLDVPDSIPPPPTGAE